ncbi:MAG: hypothetical protein KAI66_14325, partial [Lentisphaeria bacterium]|nr:hypothetical protein [Lentisphaeria bacterium]
AAMVAVCRAAGIPCRYVYGTIRLTLTQAGKWLGVDAACAVRVFEAGGVPFRLEGETVVLDRVWVRVYVGVLPSRGAESDIVPGAFGSGWIDVDPAFKQHAFTHSRSLASDLKMQSRTVLANVRSQSTTHVPGAVPGVLPSDPSQDAEATQLPRNYILDNISVNADALAGLMIQNELGLDTVFVAREVSVEAYGMLPCSDLYPVLCVARTFSRFPEQLSARVRVQVFTTDDEPALQFEASAAAAMGDTLRLHAMPSSAADQDLLEQWNPTDTDQPFPAYQVRVRACLTIGQATTEATGDDMHLGDILRVRWRLVPAGCDTAVFEHADTSRITTLDDRVPAGADCLYMLNAGQVPDALLDECASTLDAVGAQRVDWLRAVALGYFHHADRFCLAAASVAGQYARRSLSLVRVSAGMRVERIGDVDGACGTPFKAHGGLLGMRVLHDGLRSAPRSSTASDGGVWLPPLHALSATVLATHALGRLTGLSADGAAALLCDASAQDIPILSLRPDPAQCADFADDPTLLQAYALGHHEQIQRGIVSFLRMGYTVVTTQRPLGRADGRRLAPVVALDPAGGATQFCVADEEDPRQLFARTDTMLGNGAFSVPDLLLRDTVPDESGERAVVCLRSFPDTLGDTAYAFLPGLAHAREWFADDLGKFAPTALSTTAACIALGASLEEDLRIPVIGKAIIAPRAFSPLTGTLAISADILAATSWTVRVNGAAGQRVRGFASGADARIIDLQWNGLSDAGAEAVDGEYTVRIVATNESASVDLTSAVTLDRTVPEANLSLARETIGSITRLTFTGTAQDTNLDHWQLTLVDRSSQEATRNLAAGNLSADNATLAVVAAESLVNGEYDVRLEVVDRAGNTTQVELSEPLRIDHPPADTEPPSLQIEGVSATGDPPLLCGTVAVTVRAFDNRAVSTIRIFLDGAQIAGMEDTDIVEVMLDCTEMSEGGHTLRAEATDSSENTTKSGEIAFFSSVQQLDTVPPTLALAFPDTSRPLAGTVAVIAQATDNTGVSRMEIWLDGERIAQADHPDPARLVADMDCSALREGSHTLFARAEDAAGNVSELVPIAFSSLNTTPDSQPPGLSLTVPQSTGALTGRIPVTATATDNVGVKTLRLVLDGATLREVGSPTPPRIETELDATVLAPGAHTLRAEATDFAGNSATTATVTITTAQTAPDTVSPSISLASPVDLQDLSGTVRFVARAADNVGVARLQMWLDNALFREVADPDPAELAVAIDTSSLADGAHTVRAAASDAVGNTAESATVSFTTKAAGVDSSAPAFVLNVPGAEYDSRLTTWPVTMGGVLSGTQAVRVAASDNVGVKRIEITLDGTPLAVSSETLLDFSFDTSVHADGWHSLKIGVEDTAGNRAEGVVRLRLSNDAENPTVSLETSVVDVSEAVTGDVRVRATASDDRAVSRLSIVLDGLVVASATSPEPAELIHTIHETDLADGAHGVLARAEDAAGNIAESAAVAFTTSNPVSGFVVAPSLVVPGMPSGTDVEIAATLRAAGRWHLLFSGPTTIDPVSGEGTVVSATVDAATLEDGVYAVTLTADTALGVKSFKKSFRVNLITGPPIADISSLANAFDQTGAPVAVSLDEGLFEIMGRAEDPDPEDEVSWRLDLLRLDGGVLRNLTPGADAGGWNTSRVPEGGSFGELDLTLVRGGVYD